MTPRLECRLIVVQPAKRDFAEFKQGVTVSAADELVGSDLILLLLAAPTSVDSARGRINGITRLEKLLYLVEKESKIPALVTREALRYVAYDYGPFSKDVYEAVDILEEAKLLQENQRIDEDSIDGLEEVQVTGAIEEDQFIERRFQLTPNGTRVADLLASRHPEVVHELTRLKDVYAARPLSSLIRYVYSTYPESAVNSKIRDRFI